MRRQFKWMILVPLLLAACSGNSGDDDWGDATEQFFAEWSDAWARSDSYDIARFYDVDVAVELAQDYRSLSLNAGFRGTSVSGAGRVWLVEWIEAQYEPKVRSLGGIYVGAESAGVLVEVDEINAAFAVAMGVDDGAISRYTDLRWRDAHLDGGEPDARLEWLDDLVDTHVAALVNPATAVAEELYRADATIDAFPIFSGSAGAAPLFSEADVGTVETGDREGRAIFVGPDQVAYVLSAATIDGCQGEYMVSFVLTDERIASEQRMPTPDTMRRCFSAEVRPDGWWNSLAIPLPVGEQKTGAIAERDGTEIAVFNGTAELEQLLVWGLERYEQAGLRRPEILTASFAPLPICSTLPGVVTDSADGGADLVLCTDAYTACEPDRETCANYSTGDRLGMLHELGHAWLLSNISPETQDRFLDVVGLDSWTDGSVAWHERGVEQAAEIVAWGLMDEDIRLIRIGEPPCSLAAEAYEVLTGSAPLRDCE